MERSAVIIWNGDWAGWCLLCRAAGYATACVAERSRHCVPGNKARSRGSMFSRFFGVTEAIFGNCETRGEGRSLLIVRRKWCLARCRRALTAEGVSPRTRAISSPERSLMWSLNTALNDSRKVAARSLSKHSTSCWEQSCSGVYPRASIWWMAIPSSRSMGSLSETHFCVFPRIAIRNTEYQAAMMLSLEMRETSVARINSQTRATKMENSMNGMLTEAFHLCSINHLWALDAVRVWNTFHCPGTPCVL